MKKASSAAQRAPQAARLRERRQQLGLTLEDVARAAGVSRQAVNCWEAGRCAPNVRYVHALAEVLRVPLAWLLEGGAPPPVRPSSAELHARAMQALIVRE